MARPPRSATPGSQAVIAAIVVAGVVLRSTDLGRSFDLDEAVSAWAVGSPERLANFLPQEIHPPPWYLLLFAWSRSIGDGDIPLRSSSLLAGALWLPLFAVLAERLFDRRTALIALAIAAISPLAVAEAGLLREYAWIPLTTTLATLATIAALEDERPRRWVLCGLALALAAAVNYQGLALAAGLFIGTAWCGASRRGLALSGVVAAVASIPTLVALLLFFAPSIRKGAQGIGTGSIVQVWSGLSVGELPHVDAALVVVLAALAGVAAILGARRIGEWWRIFVPVFVLAGGAPVVLAQTVINYPLRPLFFTVLLPFVILLIARAVATAGRPATRAAAGTGVAAVAAGLLLLLTIERRHPDDFRGLAQLLECRTTDERAIVVAPAFYAIPLERYYEGALAIRKASREEAAAVLSSVPRADGEINWLILDRWSVPTAIAGATEVETGWWMRAFRVHGPPP